MKGLIGFMAKHTIQIDVVSMYGPGKPIPDVKQASPAENVTADAQLVRQLISIPLLTVYEAGTENVINGHNFYQYFPEEQPGGGGGGGGGGDVSRYTVEKATDSGTGEVTYKLMEQLNNGTAHAVGDVIGFRGTQMLVSYGNELTILDTAIATIKEKIDAQYNFTTFTELNITTSGKSLKQITDELYAKNLPTNTIVTGQMYTEALPFSGNGEAEVMINGTAFWWTCKSLTEAPYSWNAITAGGSPSVIKMDWTPTYFTGKPLDYTSYSNERLTIHKMT